MHPSVSPYKQNQQFNIFVSSIFHSFILPFLPGYLQKVPFYYNNPVRYVRLRDTLTGPRSSKKIHGQVGI